ncbi:hypothetical protein N8Z26_03755 [Burkholderiales bacterium]|nr:hypothetical protein [Burkholderiales bacterium]
MEAFNGRWRRVIDKKGSVASAKTVHHLLKHRQSVHRKITHMQRQILGERTLS